MHAADAGMQEKGTEKRQRSPKTGKKCKNNVLWWLKVDWEKCYENPSIILPKEKDIIFFAGDAWINSEKSLFFSSLEKLGVLINSVAAVCDEYCSDYYMIDENFIDVSVYLW